MCKSNPFLPNIQKINPKLTFSCKKCDAYPEVFVSLPEKSYLTYTIMEQKRYGHFDDQHREYVITDPQTPWPWINYLGKC